MFLKKNTKDNIALYCFIILLLYMLISLPPLVALNHYCIVPYMLTYELGFISRGLIGSLVSIFSAFISVERIYFIILINQTFLCILVIYFISQVYKCSTTSTERGLLWLFYLFIINPGSVAFLFLLEDFGRLDLYLIVITITCCLVLIKNKNKWLLPILCILAVLIHQGFVFSYFPIIIILISYKAISQKDYRLVGIITLLFTCSLFLIMQFGGKITAYSYDQVIDIVSHRTDLNLVNNKMIKAEYFTPITDFIDLFVIPNFKLRTIKSMVTLFLCIPLIAVIYKIWKSYVTEKQSRFYWIIPLSIVLAVIPKFILTCDWGRDFASIIISQFLLIFSIYAMNDQEMHVTLKLFTDKLKVNKSYYLFVLLESAMIGKFEASNISEISNKIIDTLNYFI